MTSMRANTRAASASFRKLAAGLRSVASGQAAERTALAVAKQLEQQARAALSGHDRTGRASSSLTVHTASKSVAIAAAAYLRFHTWWPFRDGIPAQAVQHAARTFREETVRLIASR